MAKKNNYWGLVAVGALTDAAAGAVAAHLVKNHRKNNMLDDDFEDLDDFEELDDFEDRIKEEKETFQAWDIPVQEETEAEEHPEQEASAPEESTEEAVKEDSAEEDSAEENSAEAPEEDTTSDLEKPEEEKAETEEE